MDILERIATALERNNELLAGAAEGRERVLAAAEAASTKAAPKAAAAKKDDKPAADKPAAAEKPADKAPAETSDGPTIEEINAVISTYVGGTDRTEERAARAAKLKGVLTKNADAELVKANQGKANGGTLLADKRAAFVKAVEGWIEAGDLTEAPAAEEEASGDDELLG